MKRALFAAFALFALSCGGGDSPSNRGVLLLSYFQGGGEAGALLLTITGGPVDSVSAVGGQQVSFASPSSGVTRVIVAGTLANGDVLKLYVPDVNQVTQYHAHTDQVADKTTFALMSPSSYSLTVHR